MFQRYYMALRTYNVSNEIKFAESMLNVAWNYVLTSFNTQTSFSVSYRVIINVRN